MASSSHDQVTSYTGDRITEKRPWTWYRLTEGIAPYLLVAPLLILIGVFIYWPLVYSMYLSFFDWNFVQPDKTFLDGTTTRAYQTTHGSCGRCMEHCFIP